MTTPPSDSGTSACVDFEVRDCVIDLGVVNGVHNCADGRQICENGVWTACTAL